MFTRIVLGSCLSIPVGASIAADVHVTETNRVEQLEEGAVVRTSGESTNELWLGEDRVSYTQGDKTWIVDLDAGVFTWVNHGTRTWCSASLPLELDELYSAELKLRFRDQRTTGEVVAGDEMLELGGKPCRRYDVRYWDMEGDAQANRREIVVWATTDVDFDWKPIGALLEPVRTIYGRDAALRAGLASIEGVQMRTQVRLDDGRVYMTDVTSIEERDPSPDEDPYAPPEGYRQVETLTGRDF